MVIRVEPWIFDHGVTSANFCPIKENPETWITIVCQSGTISKVAPGASYLSMKYIVLGKKRRQK